MSDFEIVRLKAEYNDIFTSLDFKRISESKLYETYVNKDKLQIDVDFRYDNARFSVGCYHEYSQNQYDTIDRDFDSLEEMLSFLDEYDSSLSAKITAALRKMKLERIAAVS